MEHASVQRDGFTVVGMKIRTSNENPGGIGKLWHRYRDEGLADRIEGRVDDGMVAVYCEYEKDHTEPYTFLLGCAVSPDAPVPEGMTKREIPGGTYAEVAAEGEMPQALVDTWVALWGSDIERAFTLDYEIHSPAHPGKVRIFLSV